MENCKKQKLPYSLDREESNINNEKKKHTYCKFYKPGSDITELGIFKNDLGG